MSIAVFTVVGVAQNNAAHASIDAYIQPYFQSKNFSGDVLVEKNGKIVFHKAYGFADVEHRIPNTPATRFHIASMSMQFTAAAVLRLADRGSLKLDERVSDFVPEIDGSEKITIRDLLTERSGLPDINSMPEYENLLQHHQTPATLVEKIEHQPLLFEPGSKFLHEEHSAYNLLALIIEKISGLSFAAAVEGLVFQPIGLTVTSEDDDSVPHAKSVADGYQPEGAYGLKPANSIHWSAKTGNASVYTTAADEARWVSMLFSGNALSSTSRDAMLQSSGGIGYGWFRNESKRFGQTAYYMNGRAPGFSSFVLFLPQAHLTVVVLSNIYSSATTTIGYDIAALSLGLPYESLHFQNLPLSPQELKSYTGTFRFGPDFYQSNAELKLIANDKEVSLRWPSGDISALIPIGQDSFVDRSYWEPVKIERDPSGRPTALHYDRFAGEPSGQNASAILQ